MKQAVPGVAPAESGEVTVMTVWPSIAATPTGRLLGVGYACGWGFGKFFTAGKLVALLSIPVALALYFARVLPPLPFTWPYNRRYRLTNRRVVELADRMRWDLWRGLLPRPRFAIGEEVASVALEGFDAIDVHVAPGQEWFHAGDLVFRRGTLETFRLVGVSRPQTFRHTCLKARMGYVGIRRRAEPAPA
jgi:hypothetical protein